MSERLTIHDFLPHLHTIFKVEHSEGDRLELTEATDDSNVQLEQFSLIFIGKPSPCLQQGLYRLTHPQIPNCELFLVPIGPDPDGMRYQAVFSCHRRVSQFLSEDRA